MRSVQKPSGLRWLYRGVLGSALLVFALLLKLAEGPACRLFVLPWEPCPRTHVTYVILFGVAAVCLLNSLYHVYRDFFRRDLERELATRSGHAPRGAVTEVVTEEPVVADAVQHAWTAAGRTNEVTKQLETMFAKHQLDQSSSPRDPST